MYLAVVLLLCAFSSVSGVRDDLECVVNSDYCSCDFNDGRGKINLAPLASSSKDKPAFNLIQDPGRSYSYAFNPCSPFNDGSGCSVEKDTAACQRGTDTGGGLSVSLGAQRTVSFNVTDEETRSVLMIITSGDDGRKTLINLVCDEKFGTTAVTSNMTFVKEEKQYHYVFNLRSKCACVDGCKGPSHLLLSIGTIILIGLAFVIIIYLVAGILFRKFKQGATGAEVIPNHSFWFSLPGHIKDGIKFSFRKCRKSSVEYEALQ